MFISRRRAPLVRGEGREFAVRLGLMGVLFALVAWAYWLHFESRFATIAARSLIVDEQKDLSRADLDRLASRAARFRQAWGLRPLSHLPRGAVTLPELPPDTLFVGLNAATEQAVVALPPLLTRLLTPEQRRRMEHDLLNCAALRPPVDCIIQTLDHLDGLLTRSASDPASTLSPTPTAAGAATGQRFPLTPANQPDNVSTPADNSARQPDKQGAL